MKNESNNSDTKNVLFTVLEYRILTDKNISSTSKLLYQLIYTKANNDKGFCFSTNKELMSALDLSERQFYRCILELRQYGYIDIIKTNKRSYIMPTSNNMYLYLQNKVNKVEKPNYYKTKKIVEPIPNWFNKEINEDIMSDEDLIAFEKELGI